MRTTPSDATAMTSPVRRLLDRLRALRRRARGRALLARLDERMLRDIGVRREDAQREADKPFWRR